MKERHIGVPDMIYERDEYSISIEHFEQSEKSVCTYPYYITIFKLVVESNGDVSIKFDKSLSNTVRLIQLALIQEFSRGGLYAVEKYVRDNGGKKRHRSDAYIFE